MGDHDVTCWKKDVPVELKLMIFGHLKDRWGLLRTLDYESKGIIDSEFIHLQSSHGPKTNCSVVFESESLFQWICETFGIVVHNNYRFSCINRGFDYPLDHLFFGHIPPTLQTVRASIKKNRMDIFDRFVHYFDTTEPNKWLLVKNCIVSLIHHQSWRGVTHECIKLLLGPCKQFALQVFHSKLIDCSTDEQMITKLFQCVNPNAKQLYPRDIGAVGWFVLNSIDSALSIHLVKFHPSEFQKIRNDKSLIQLIDQARNELLDHLNDKLCTTDGFFHLFAFWSNRPNSKLRESYASRDSESLILHQYESLALLIISSVTWNKDESLKWMSKNADIIVFNAHLLEALVNHCASLDKDLGRIYPTDGSMLLESIIQSLNIVNDKFERLKRILTTLCIQHQWVSGLMVLDRINLLFQYVHGHGYDTIVSFGKWDSDIITTSFYEQWIKNKWERFYPKESMFYNIFTKSWRGFNENVAESFVKLYNINDHYSLFKKHMYLLFSSPVVVHWLLIKSESTLINWNNICKSKKYPQFYSSICSTTLNIIDKIMQKISDSGNIMDVQSIINSLASPLHHLFCKRAFRSVFQEFDQKSFDCSHADPIDESKCKSCQLFNKRVHRFCLELIVFEIDRCQWNIGSPLCKKVYESLLDELVSDDVEKFLNFFIFCDSTLFITTNWQRFEELGIKSQKKTLKDCTIFWKLLDPCDCSSFASFLIDKGVPFPPIHHFDTINSIWEKSPVTCYSGGCEKYDYIPTLIKIGLPLFTKTSLFCAFRNLRSSDAIIDHLESLINHFNINLFQKNIPAHCPVPLIYFLIHPDKNWINYWINHLPCNQIETMIIDIRYGAPFLYLKKIVQCGLIDVYRLLHLCKLSNNYCDGMMLTTDEIDSLNLIQSQRSEKAIKIAQMLDN